MIKTVMSHSLIVALLLGGSSAALSADLDNILYGPQAPITKPVEVGNGWYLRGDVGYNFSTDGSADSFRMYDFAAASYDRVNYSDSEFDSDFTWGLGAGYQINNWFRVEGLATATTGKFKGQSSSGSVPCTGVAAGTGCDTRGTADYTAWGLMANGYVDMGTFSGWTPYVGAGVGATLVKYDDYRVNETCSGGACAVPPATNRTTHPGADEWRFTYALMAGVAYEFARNWKVDLGYKYTNVDGGQMYRFDSASRTAGASGVQSHDDGFDTHQILASLRYSLW